MHALRTHSLEDENNLDVLIAELPITNTNDKADTLDKSFETIDVAVLDDTHTHGDADAACVDVNATCSTCKSVNHLYQQVIPICNPADPLTTIDQLVFFHQGRATNRQLAAPSLSDEGAARFKFLHLCFGGTITAHNIGDFMETYPEFATTARLPKALMHPSITKLLPPCHCCTRSHMRKTNAPPLICLISGDLLDGLTPSSRSVRPLEELHLDLFTYPDDPRYDAFFIDRGTRACWHYVLRKKSEVPAIVQQFIVDANT
jgi:hypothetical protein